MTPFCEAWFLQEKAGDMAVDNFLFYPLKKDINMHVML